MKLKDWSKQRMGYMVIMTAIAVMGMINPGYAGYIVTPDAYWTMNDVSAPLGESIGNNTYDGQCNDATSDGCPSQTAGTVNSGQKFNSTSDEVYVNADITGNAPFDWLNNESFTIELWMRRGNDNLPVSNEVMIGRDDALDNNGGLHWWVGINDEGKARFVLRDLLGGATFEDIISDSVVTDGNWHFIVATRDYDNGQLLLYIDGESEPSSGPEPASFLGAFLHQSRPLNIGYLNDHVGDRFHFGAGAAEGGDLDEIAIYSSVLSEVTIKQHYLNGLANRGLGESFSPSITSTPLESAAIGYTYSYDVDAAGNPMPTYELASGPQGMTMLDAQSGELEWVPYYTTAGADHSYTVTARNDQNATNQNVTVSIYDLCAGEIDAYWDFNDSLDRYADSINTNHGTCTSTCPIVINSPASIAGSALQFNGSNNWIDVANDPVGTDIFDWAAADNFSIEFWMRRSTAGLGANEAAIGRDDGVPPTTTGLHWWVGINAVGQARFRLRDILDNDYELVSTTVVADGEWHHIVAIHDSDNDKLMLYIDGQPEPESGLSNATYVGGFSAPLKPLNIGYIGTGGTGSNHFGGDLDEIAIYNLALPEGIIQQHYMYSEQIERGYCNTPPEITGPQFINETEDIPFDITVDDLVIQDPDNTAGDFSLTLQAGTNYTFTGTTVTPANNFSGTLMVSMTVSDKYHESNVYDLTVNVAESNDAPVVSDIPDQEITTGETFQTITLDNYVSDVDNIVDQINWTFGGNTSLIVSISANRIATITVPQNWSGTETITFTATDVPGGAADSDTATFTVESVNAPVVSGIPDQVITADESFDLINLDEYVTDQDNTDDQMTWTYSGNTSLTISISNNRVATITAPSESWTGSETITWRATDTDGNYGEDIAEFTVQAASTDDDGGGGGGGGGGGFCFIDSLSQ